MELSALKIIQRIRLQFGILVLRKREAQSITIILP